jgi:hypothetical protein
MKREGEGKNEIIVGLRDKNRIFERRIKYKTEKE